MQAKTLFAYYVKYIDDAGNERTIMIESMDALSAYEAAVAAYDAIEAPGRLMLSRRPEPSVK